MTETLPVKEPSFRASVDLMFNRAVALMDLSPGLEEKIRVCNSTYTVRFGVRLRGKIETFTGYRSVHSEHMEPVKGHQIVKAELPLIKTFGYATQLRSLSQGRATNSMQFSHFMSPCMKQSVRHWLRRASRSSSITPELK